MSSYWDGDRWGEAAWPERVLTRLGIDGLGIDLFSYGPGVATWDGATTWGGGSWTTRTWKPIAVELTEARFANGADRALGILTVASGGSVSMNTHDPDGTLDPANPSSPFAFDLFPGSYVRVTYQGTPIFIGISDTINYSQQTGGGYIGGTDPVGVLSNVKVVVPNNPPKTLRALARALVALAGLVYVRVEPDPPSGDPAVGYPDVDDENEVGLWTAISEAAIDALHYAWVGADLLIHFWSHGDPRDRGLTLGLEGIPLADVLTQSTADGIVNNVLARGTTGTVYTTSDQNSIGRFGKQTVDRSTRRVPDPVTWADRVLADRAWASLEYLSLQIIPTEPAQLMALADMDGMDVVHIRTDLTDPPISVDVRSVGLQMNVTPDGWDAAVLGYISSAEWSGNMTPPVPTTTVPNVVGMMLADATAALTAAQLTSSTTEQENASAPGTVLTQDPVPGASVAPASNVALVVARAAVPVTATVPGIVGQTEAAALSSLSASGLSAGARTTAHSALAAGLVCAQTPAAGTQVAIGSFVGYTVSTGAVQTTRTTTSTKAARLFLSSSGGKYGSGAEAAIPVGAWEGTQNRALIGLVADFTSAVRVRKATLRLRTSTQDNVGFGTNPKVKVQRVTSSWAEGTLTSPGSGNAVVWPGPSATSTGEVAKSVTRSEDATVDIDITDIVRAWAPASAGGSGAANHGVRLVGYVESNTSYTTEFKSDDAAANRPQLILELDTI